MLSRLRRDESGFTLVELLTVITITALLGGVVLTSVVRALGITRTTTDRVEALSSLQQAHERMSRAIRAADPVDGAAPDALTVEVYVRNASAPAQLDLQRITYALTAAGDAVTQETVTYSPAGAPTPTATTTTTVIDDLDMAATALFTYETAAGPWAPGGSPADITAVQITLRHALGDDIPPVVLTTGVQIRNQPLEDV